MPLVDASARIGGVRVGPSRDARTVQCRNATEAHVCEELLTAMRRLDVEPLCIVTRHRTTGRVEVVGRARAFDGPDDVRRVMDQAALNLMTALLRGRRRVVLAGR